MVETEGDEVDDDDAQREGTRRTRAQPLVYGSSYVGVQEFTRTLALKPQTLQQRGRLLFKMRYSRTVRACVYVCARGRTQAPSTSRRKDSFGQVRTFWLFGPHNIKGPKGKGLECWLRLGTDLGLGWVRDGKVLANILCLLKSSQR